jgi:type IV secretion/conjugal transfer VirB4 family ATPase
VGDVQFTFRYSEIGAYLLLVLLFALACRYTSLLPWLRGLWREAREVCARLPDELPWYCFVDDGIILNKETKQGPGLQTTVRYRGPDVGSLSPHERERFSERLNDIFGRFEKGWTFQVHAARVEAPPIPPSRFRHAVAWLVDEERRDAYSQATLFETYCYLTFVWRLPSDAEKGVENVLFDSGKSIGSPRTAANAAFRRDCVEFKQAVAEACDVLATVFDEVVQLDNDEMCTFLKSTISTVKQEVAAPFPGAWLDVHLPDQRFTPGDTPMLGDYFIPTCVVTNYPDEGSRPAHLDILSRMPFPLWWATKCKCLGPDLTKERLEKRQSIWKRASRSLKNVAAEKIGGEVGKIDAAMLDKAADVEDALRAFGEGAFTFVDLTTTVTVWHKDRGTALDRMRMVKQALRAEKYIAREETLNAVDAWLGSIPGNTEVNCREYLLSSLNFADMMPAYSIYSGEPYSKHLESLTGQREALLHGSTSGSNPFHLNLHVRDVGHTIVLGGTGDGKTVLVLLMALQFLRYANARVIIFDRDYSARATTMAVGGVRFEPGNSAAAYGFQPLALIHDHAERLAAVDLIMSMLGCQGLADLPNYRTKVGRVLDLLASRPIAERTLMTFSLLLADAELEMAIRPYTRVGHYGHIFDADREELPDASWMLFEMSHLINKGDAVLAPALRYIFHRCTQLFDGRPTMLVVDEGSSLLKNGMFAGEVETFAETLRKKQVSLVIVAHSIKKLVASEIFPALDRNCRTRFYLPDAGAEGEESAKAYASVTPPLSPTDLQVIAGLQSKRDYYYVSDLGKRVFSLDLGPIQKAFVGMTGKEDQEVLDYIERTFPPEQHGECILLHHRLAAAAEVMRRARLGPAELVSGLAEALQEEAFRDEEKAA